MHTQPAYVHSRGLGAYIWVVTASQSINSMSDWVCQAEHGRVGRLLFLFSLSFSYVHSGATLDEVLLLLPPLLQGHLETRWALWLHEMDEV